MQNWAVHIKYATARGAPAIFDAVIRAIGARRVDWYEHASLLHSMRNDACCILVPKSAFL